MITEDEATHLLRRADPARFATRAPIVDAAGYLADLRTRSTTVTLTKTQPTDSSPSPEDRQRWPIIALAAAAVVAIVVGALVIVARDDDSSTVPADTAVTTEAPATPASAEDVLHAYIDASTGYDSDGALTYMTDEFLASHWGSEDTYRREQAWNQAARFEVIVGDCAPREGETGGAVTFECGVSMQALGTDTLGMGPYVRPDWIVTVRDGKIVADGAEGGGDSNWGAMGEVFADFTTWIHTAHPEDVALMFQADGETPWFGQSTDESISMWKQRTDDYVQFVLGTRETYAADVAAICATQARQLGQLQQPSEGSAQQLAAFATAAAAIMENAHGDLIALTKPPTTNSVLYMRFYGELIQLVRNLEDSAEAVTSAGSTEQDALHADYLRIRGQMSSGPEGSGLDQCVASPPSLATLTG